MRVLFLYAHPVETSFVAAVRSVALRSLEGRGHVVDDCDLYTEKFDPVLARDERLTYDDPAANRRNVASYVDRLLSAEALVFVFPVWNMGPPAILKGFLDRVFVPGVSFRLQPSGDYVPMLVNVRRLGVVCTYGGGALLTMAMGDPPRRFFSRTLRAICAPGAECDYLALYDMNHPDAGRRERFLARVQSRFSAW